MRIFIFLLSLTMLFTPMLSAKEKGNIQIYCQPKVKVFINKRFKSKSNEKQKGLLLKNLSYKSYTIKLSKGKVEESFTIVLNDTLVEYYSKDFGRPEDSAKIALETKLALETELTLKAKLTLEAELPELIYYVMPKFPPSLKNKNINGKIKINTFLDMNGYIKEVLIEESSGFPEFDSSAVDAAYLNMFIPEIYNGELNDCLVKYQIIFENDLDGTIIPGDFTDDNKYSSEFELEIIENESTEVMPEMIKEITPTYPRLAMQAGIEGAVWVKALVDWNGDVRKAIIGKSSGTSSIDKAALGAAYKNKYKPAKQNGRNIAIWVSYKVDFSLNR